MKVKPSIIPGEVTMQINTEDTRLLAPSEPAPFSIKTILVPFDFSAFSEKSLQYARSFAQLCGAKIVLVHVVEPRVYPENYFVIPTEMEEINIRLVSEAKDKLAEVAAANQTETVKTESSVRIGRPYLEVVDAARECGADLIVLSTHGYTGLKHVFLGSTAERVVRHARCPVLVLREHEREFVRNPSTQAA
jgi:nucleotide-binding universal stress UspA family protein